MPLTDTERDYLSSQRLGRFVTIGADGYPQARPVGVHYSAETGTIDVVGYDLSDSAKWRNVASNPKVSFVVDDLASVQPWRPRGIEIRGDAEALRGAGVSAFGDEVIRIHPRRVLSWGLDDATPGMSKRDIRPSAAAGG